MWKADAPQMTALHRGLPPPGLLGCARMRSAVSEIRRQKCQIQLWQRDPLTGSCQVKSDTRPSAGCGFVACCARLWLCLRFRSKLKGSGVRGERGAGTGAPASLLDRLPPRPAEPCVFATWKPFLFFMWGDGRLSGIEIAPCEGEPGILNTGYLWNHVGFRSGPLVQTKH